MWCEGWSWGDSELSRPLPGGWGVAESFGYMCCAVLVCVASCCVGLGVVRGCRGCRFRAGGSLGLLGLSVVLCWFVLFRAGLCCAVLCCAVLCCAVLCCAVLSCAVLC